MWPAVISRQPCGELRGRALLVLPRITASVGAQTKVQTFNLFLPLRVYFYVSSSCDSSDLMPIIKFVIKTPQPFNYTINQHKELNVLYNDILKCLSKLKKDKRKKPTVTTITKIMLGVYGCVPAFDSRFVKAFNSQFKNKSYEKRLQVISDFYNSNKDEIDELAKRPLRDAHYNDLDIKYTVARLIDCYGWALGGDQ